MSLSTPASAPSTHTIPPPLPTSVLTSLLPHLLPPSQLPQELVSKSLLQRILYLSPDPSDLDAHLTPFPSSSTRSITSASASDSASQGYALDPDAQDQPISSRLRELARGHKLGATQYTREGEEVFARIVISDEDEQVEGSVEVWFEFEFASGLGSGAEGNEGRGWVYHSARLPSNSPSSSVNAADGGRWVSAPESLPAPLSLEGGEAAPQDEESGLEAGEAPAGYWDSFNSAPPSPSLDQHQHQHDHNQAYEDEQHQAVEDAYWAQYSRPATAPMTPAPITPGEPMHPKKELTSQEETARKLTESLTQLGLGHINNVGGAASGGSGYSSGAGSGLGHGQNHKQGFVHCDPRTQFGALARATQGTTNTYTDEAEYDQVEVTHLSSSLNGNNHENGSGYGGTSRDGSAAGTGPGSGFGSASGKRGFYEPTLAREESGREVKDRLKGKIGSALRDLWKEFSSSAESPGGPVGATHMDEHEHEHEYGSVSEPILGGLDEGEMEQRGMEWLRLARAIVDQGTSPSPSPSSSKTKHLNGYRHGHGTFSNSNTNTNGYATAIAGNLNMRRERVEAKLETLFEMYAVLNDSEPDNFFRLVEAVIVRQARAVPHFGADGAGGGYAHGDEGDEVMRQEMYYE